MFVFATILSMGDYTSCSSSSSSKVSKLIKVPPAGSKQGSSERINRASEMALALALAEREGKFLTQGNYHI